jgi:hypothetical protein
MADTDFEQYDDGPMGDISDDSHSPDDSSGSEVSALFAPLAANPLCVLLTIVNELTCRAKKTSFLR